MANEVPIFQVSDFLASVNQTLEYAYPGVDIEGEVASFKVNQGKFVFFDLKDAEGSIGCFMTIWQLRIPVEDGMKVVVRAVPKLTAWGKFSLTVQTIRPSGEGSLKRGFELLKQKLEKEGLFDQDRKRVLPAIPERIAVISSVQSAGYADFIKIIGDRWGGIVVDVANVQVQGASAPDQIIRAIKHFNTQAELAEVLVIVRGGGSADDLSVFNDELLVREVSASRIPTLIAIGHEIDTVLAELASDVRASTPSNAGVVIVPDKREIIDRVRVKLAQVTRAYDDNVENLHQSVQARLADMLDNATRQIDSRSQQIGNYRSKISAYNPISVMERGYAIVRGQVVIGSQIQIDRVDDMIKAEVIDVKKRPNN